MKFDVLQDVEIFRLRVYAGASAHIQIFIILVVYMDHSETL